MVERGTPTESASLLAFISRFSNMPRWAAAKSKVSDAAAPKWPSTRAAWMLLIFRLRSMPALVQVSHT
jgi:hypothetical protein